MRFFASILLVTLLLVVSAYGMDECEKEEDCFHLIGPCTDVKCGRGGHCQAFSTAEECPCPEDTLTPYHLHELTDETFEDAIASGGVWFINFYGPWCGWCKRLAPTWDNLHSLVRERWNVGAVDCKEYPALCQEYIADKETGTMGYPTLDLFEDGKFVDRYGVKERDFGRLIRWVESKVNVERTCLPRRMEPKIVSDTPSSDRDGDVVVVSDENAAATFASGTKDWLVKFYAPWCGHCKRMADAWRELASTTNYHIAEVDCTVHTDTAGAYGVRGYPTIHLLRDGKSVAQFSGTRDVETFVSFLRENDAAAVPAEEEEEPNIVSDQDTEPEAEPEPEPVADDNVEETVASAADSHDHDEL